jgi:DNA-binding NarL/FixJ family response regulator
MIMNELTTIEQEIMMLLAKGFTAKQIANEQVKSVHTVNNQIASLKEKFDAKNTTNLMFIIMSLFSFEFENREGDENE